MIAGLAEPELLLAQGEHAALYAACDADVALCTVVGIEGSFSRRLGAQLAVHAEGSVSGSLSDGCLEQQLVSDALNASEPTVIRYGYGSAQIDFRLPCGGGLDVLIDPDPDRAACRAVICELENRRAASLALGENQLLEVRDYLPSLRIQAFGGGQELIALETIAAAAGIAIEARDMGQLSLGSEAKIEPADPWTAVVMLFHDHEWEAVLLKQALRSGAFYIGAQGGENARVSRTARLISDGISEEQVARLRGPIGSVPSCRTPPTLALSILSEIVGEYEKLQSRH